MPVEHVDPAPIFWTVFDKPIKCSDIDGSVVTIPGTQETDKCLIISVRFVANIPKNVFMDRSSLHP